jgi:phosphoserine phosphatase RsbU/P
MDDLNTAGQLQRMLLPPAALSLSGWQAVHVFEPAGVVSGDYVDLVPHDDGLYFMLGDVSGKGVAASLLMAQLHAMFRTLVPFRLPLDGLMARASALLCASSLPTQYATLVCGYLDPSGSVEISNAGHPPPLIATGGNHATVHATGVPMGLFCESQFSSSTFTLASGDTLLMYTDGLSEARNGDGEEYGPRRIADTLSRHATRSLRELLDACLADQLSFRDGGVNTDDLTVLAVRRSVEGEDSRLVAGSNPVSSCAARPTTAC